MKKLILGIAPVKRAMLPMEAAKAQKEELFPLIRTIKADHVEIVYIDDLCEN